MGNLWLLVGALALALLAMVVAMRIMSQFRRRLKEGRVIGIVGQKGHGKTLFAVHEMLRTVGRQQRCQKCSYEQGKRVTHPIGVASNVGVALDKSKAHLYRRVTSMEDVYALPHMTLLVLDEVQLWWPAKQGFQLSDDEVEWLTQCRKHVCEVLWISQHEDRVALGLRRLTDLLGKCQRTGFGWMKVTFWQPEMMRKPKMHEHKYRYKVTKRLGAAYNTYEWQSVGGGTKTSGVPPTKEAVPAVPRSITTPEGTYRHIA